LILIRQKANGSEAKVAGRSPKSTSRRSDSLPARMEKLIIVHKSEHDMIVRWVMSAENYSGIWADAEGDGHTLKVGGRRRAVTWSGIDNFAYEDGRPEEMVYMVDERLYNEWIGSGKPCR